MPKKVTNAHIIVHRTVNDVATRVNPPIGKIFNYTDQEVTEILGAKKNALLEPTVQEEASRDELVAGSSAVDSGPDASKDKAVLKPGDAPTKPNARALKGAGQAEDI